MGSEMCIRDRPNPDHAASTNDTKNTKNVVVQDMLITPVESADHMIKAVENWLDNR